MFTVNKVWLDCKANKLRVSYTGDWLLAPYQVTVEGNVIFYKGIPGEYNPDVIPIKIRFGLRFIDPWYGFTSFSCCNKDFKTVGELRKVPGSGEPFLEYHGPPLPDSYFYQFAGTDTCCRFKGYWALGGDHPDHSYIESFMGLVPSLWVGYPRDKAEITLYIWDKNGCPLYKINYLCKSNLFLNISYDTTKGIDYSHSPNPSVVIPPLPPKGTKLPPGYYCYSIYQELDPLDNTRGITKDFEYLPICKELIVFNAGNNLECPLTLGKEVLVDKTIGCDAFIQNKSNYQLKVKLLEALGFSDLCDPIEGFKESKSYKIPPGKSLKVPMGSSRYATKVVIEYTYGDKTCTLEKCIGFCESALRGKDKTPFPIVTKKVSMSKEDFIVFYNPIENGGVVLKLQSELAGNLPSSFTINPGESVGFSIDKFSSDTISYETSSKDYPKRKISSSTDLTSGEDITINNVHGILYGKKHIIHVGSAVRVSSF